MRVAQLDVEGQRIEFHPYVTVLRGLSPRARTSLLSALGGLAEGSAAASGLVEVHDVLLDLSAETMALLDLEPSHADSVDVVLRAEQLPRALRPRTLARNELDRRREKIVAELARFEAMAEPGHRARGDELEERAEHRKVAETRLEGADAARTEARQSLQTQQERVARARQRRAEATRHVDEAWDALQAAQAERDPLAVDLDPDRRDVQPSQSRNGDGSDPSDPSDRIEELVRRRADLETSLLTLETIDPFLVERALGQLASDNDVELIAPAEAHRVADEWVQNETALGAAGAVEILSGDVFAETRRRLEAARAALVETELAARAREVDLLDREALDDAHEAVVAVQDRASRRVGGRRAREKLAETQATEQAILDRLGFDTYASFMITRSVEQVDTEREHGLATLRDELFSAEDAFGVLEQRIGAELDHAVLLSRRQELCGEATQILGRDPGDDLEWALRQHRVEVKIDDDRVGKLRAVLQSAGLALADPLPQHMLVELAEIWLAEQPAASHRQDELRRELGDVYAAIRRAGAGAEDEQVVERQRESQAAVTERESSLAEALEAERSAVAEVVAAERSEAEAASIEHESSAERARLEAERGAAVAAEREVADAGDDSDERETVVARAEAAAATARGELAATDRLLERLASTGDDGPAVRSVAGIEDLEWYLLSRVAKQRTEGYAGSLPLVLDHAIRGVRGEALEHLLGCLEGVSSIVQIVILSDDSEISTWAEDVGPERAATH
jgi:hypothetical protein